MASKAESFPMSWHHHVSLSLQWRHDEHDGVLNHRHINFCSTVCTGDDQRKHQSSAPLAVMGGINHWPVDSPQKGPVTRKMFPFDDVSIHFPRQPSSVCVEIPATALSRVTWAHMILSSRILRCPTTTWSTYHMCIWIHYVNVIFVVRCYWF